MTPIGGAGGEAASFSEGGGGAPPAWRLGDEPHLNETQGHAGHNSGSPQWSQRKGEAAMRCGASSKALAATGTVRG